MTVTAPIRLYAVEEYLQLEECAEDKHEYLNGKIDKMPGATGIHNIIVANVITALNIALKKREKKYIVIGSDMKIRIEAFNHIRYPDAVVVCEKLEYYGNRQDVIVNPLLIVEVLSDSTAEFDRGIKFEEYKTLSSFREYVLISQRMTYVTTYFREEDELWRIHNTTNPQDIVDLRSLECRLALQDIYEHIDLAQVENQ